MAKELIDLRGHAGVHPRIGATDVLPFVPVSGVTMDECIALAHEAGRRIWNEHSIPVYFYERAALRPERIRLEYVRGKGFEWLRRELKSILIVRRMSAIKVARKCRRDCRRRAAFLIAFQCESANRRSLDCRSIAREVRERDGGLPS